MGKTALTRRKRLVKQSMLWSPFNKRLILQAVRGTKADGGITIIRNPNDRLRALASFWEPTFKERVSLSKEF